VLRRLIMDTDWSKGEIIFTFDGDNAGKRAALRAFEAEDKFVTQTYVSVQADGLDPCDVRRSHGDAAVRDLIARRVPLYEFAIRSLLDEYDLDTAEGRIAALDAAARFIARIKDDALRKVYAGRVDRWLGLNDPDLILRRIAAHLPGPKARPARPGRAARPYDEQGTENGHHRSFGKNGQEIRYDLGDPVVQLERQVLQLAVQRPGLCGPEFDALGADAFSVPVHQAVFTLIAACGGTAGAVGSAREWAARLRDEAPNDRAQAFITGLAVEPPPVTTGEPDASYADNLLARIGEIAVSREIAVIKARLQRMNPLEDQVKYNRLYGDLIALEQRRRALVERSAGG
jgi:DNA primase